MCDIASVKTPNSVMQIWMGEGTYAYESYTNLKYMTQTA